MKYFLAMIFLGTSLLGWAQCDWQQYVNYDIDVNVDAKAYQYKGDMKVDYTNNSPDTLKVVYFHLYYNAFQPGSAMDERLKNIPDPDGRMVNNIGTKEAPVYTSRISELKPNEIGYQKIESIHQSGKALSTEVSGTILKVNLVESLLPNQTTELSLKWEAQVPVHIRRSGRQNKEGVELSMAQWYPKIAAYDREGWHLNEYIAREFYAPFGNFDVSIDVPSNYIIGGSGVLQNSEKYPSYNKSIKAKTKSGRRTWNFKAENIHDFVWAADPDYKVESLQVEEGPLVYLVYDKNLDEVYEKSWQDSKEYIAHYFDFMKDHFGAYPWSTYSIVQGGDGGMEYGTATLITAKRSFESLTGVIFHEGSHSWFQHLFGINEGINEWMDEGFTSFADASASHHIFDDNPSFPNPYFGAYQGYFNLVKSGLEEPLGTPADFYDYNYAYSIAAYYKGQVYLSQLQYIIGEEALEKTFKEFYRKYKFKHPTPTDFMKVAEDVSGINLKWYQSLFVNTTRTIDYSIELNSEKELLLKNESNFPMPIDVLVTFTDGSKTMYYIPLQSMRASKDLTSEYYHAIEKVKLPAWVWTKNNYSIKTTKPIESAVIDYTRRLADLNFENNTVGKPELIQK